MADDPTTTGARGKKKGKRGKQAFTMIPDADGAPAGIVPLPIRLESEPTLTLSLPKSLEIHADGQSDVVFALHLIRRSATSETDWAPVGSYAASWPLLESQEKMDAWLEQTLVTFAKGLSGVMLNGAALFLKAAAARALAETGLAPFTKRGILQDFVSNLEKILRDTFGVEQGRPPLWNHVELSTAILEAMRGLSPGQRNYDKVSERLRASHPGRGPKSGASLKKMVASLKIDWMGIKRSFKK
jgi:hypothetical protein